MVWYVSSTTPTPSLQATLTSATADYAGSLQDIHGPHHPITCAGGGYLAIDEDSTIRCDHSFAGPECLRNQALIDTTIAFLLIEIAVNTL